MNRMMFSACVTAALATTLVQADQPNTAERATVAPSLRYEAVLGTLPTEQGWDLRKGALDGDDEIVGSELHLNVSDGDIIVFVADTDGFDWNDGLRLSMRVRVPAGVVAGQGFRGGASLFAQDSHGYLYGVLVGAEGYVFSSQSNFEIDPLRTVQRPFDGASAFHTYCITSYVDGAVLSIDGIPRAYVPLGDLESSAGSSRVQWSVDSQHGPVESEWEDVFFANDSPCPADLNGDCRVDSADLAILLAGWGVCQ